MVDSRFFNNTGPYSLGDIAKVSNADTSAPYHTRLYDVAPLQTASSKDLSFFDNKKYLDALKQTQAGAVFVKPEFAAKVPQGTAALVTLAPYAAYAAAAQLFYPPAPARISRHAVIEDTAEIGENCTIGAGAYIGHGVKLGKNCVIAPHVSIRHSLIGNNVAIAAGARIGEVGFGFAITDKGIAHVPQLGRVIIEDFVTIGANTTIDRGAGPDTVIGMGTQIDNLVQIGHNVVIGKACVLVSQSGIAGSSRIEDYCMIGGQAGIGGHLNITAGTKIAAKAGVMRDITQKGEYMGMPAIPVKQFFRQATLLKRWIQKDHGAKK